jgi:hypothetical protein
MAHITLQCAGICCNNKIDIELPDGWHNRSYASCNDVYCGSCKQELEFFAAVCPGCIQGYPDCVFTEIYAYQFSTGLTKDQERNILDGRCPKRHDGTFRAKVGSTKITPFDISDKAPKEASAFVVQQIKKYMKKYNLPKEF